MPVRRARRLERNDAKPLLDREHARMRVGAVTVPFGTFTERPTSTPAVLRAHTGSAAWDVGTSAPTPPAFRAA